MESLTLATRLLQRVRLESPMAGMWEAADVQWWWRRPRDSDAVAQKFWSDGNGPVAAALLTEWNEKWQLDAIVVPRLFEALLPEVWQHGLEQVDRLAISHVEVLARDDDDQLLDLLEEAGFVQDADQEENGGVTWMRAEDRPPISPFADGYVLTDRGQHREGTHWLAQRNGPDVEDRLSQCSLYVADLDLAVLAPDGSVAAYGLFWHDPVTSVGLVEPMRTEEAHQRKGLARAVLSNGLDRLSRRGTQRLKVGYATAVAHDLYTGSGFEVAATDHAFVLRASP